jgi:hypothetical protein
MSEGDSTPAIEFREIPSAPGYRASNTGEVESSFKGEWQRLRLQIVTKGRKRYKFIRIRYTGSVRNVTVHRLVLEAFVGPCPPGMEGCHNNGDTFDNRLENLRWDTRVANHGDKRSHGTHKEGSQIVGAKFDEAIVEEIIVMLVEGKSGREIRKRFKVSPKLLNKIARKTHWKHVVPDRPVMSVPRYSIGP